MKTDLRFLNSPIEDLWCQSIVMLTFQGPSIVKGAFSRINDKIGGSLEDVLNAGLWTGEKGENFLIATQNTIIADKLLMRGLGPEATFGVDILINEIEETVCVLDKLGVREFAVNMPYIKSREDEYGFYLETASDYFIGSFYNIHKNDSDFLLKILFSIESEFMCDVEPVIKRLKEKSRPGLDFSIISDRCSNKDYEEVI